VRRGLTDNGTGYKRRFGEAAQALGLRWTRTKPYHPWTNGRVERFNRTLQRERIYAGEHFTSDEQRRYAIALWVSSYIPSAHTLRSVASHPAPGFRHGV